MDIPYKGSRWFKCGSHEYESNKWNPSKHRIEEHDMLNCQITIQFTFLQIYLQN